MYHYCYHHCITTTPRVVVYSCASCNSSAASIRIVILAFCLYHSYSLLYCIYCVCRSGMFFFQCHHNYHSLYIVCIAFNGCITSFRAAVTEIQVIFIVAVADAADDDAPTTTDEDDDYVDEYEFAPTAQFLYMRCFFSSSAASISANSFLSSSYLPSTDM